MLSIGGHFPAREMWKAEWLHHWIYGAIPSQYSQQQDPSHYKHEGSNDSDDIAEKGMRWGVGRY